MKITKEMGIIPKNTTITSGEPIFIEATHEPIKIYGFDHPYVRIPEEVGKNTSPEVERLGRMSTGCVIRFKTDSDYIVVHADVGYSDPIGLMSPLASHAFDIYFYEDGKYIFKGSFVPSQGEGKDYVESRLRFDGKMHDIVIACPIKSYLTDISIALRCGCEILPPSPYKYEKPVVFYGSSIVHGIGAGRPGMVYPLIISRMLDTSIRNLGFSGAARAEDAILDYICGLDMSVFVYDYDHNAPTPEYLEKTHFAGYKRFRKAQPTTPIVMATRPDYHADPERCEKFRQIIEANYKKAIDEGDTLVSFVDGRYMYDADWRNELTSDNCHPNDAGYIAMAKAIGEKVRQYIEK